jgi:hypothetical protein
MPRRKNKKEAHEMSMEDMRAQVISIIENTQSPVTITRVYETLTGKLTQKHPVDHSVIRVIT